MKTKYLISAISLLALFVFANCENKEPDTRETPVTYTQIAQGNARTSGGSEVYANQNMIITNQEQWEILKTALGSRLTNSLTESDIDFAVYQLVAVFDEVKSNGDWTIDVVSVVETSSSIVVTLQNLHTGGVTAVMTLPYQIVKIPVSNKEIFFKKINASEESPNNILQWTKWKLIEVSITKNYQQTEIINYSEKNIIYEFQGDNILVITGNIDDLFIFEDFKVGEHFYKYSEPNVCPTCLPGPNLLIDRPELGHANGRYYCNLDSNNQTMSIVGNKVIDGVFFSFGKTFIKFF